METWFQPPAEPLSRFIEVMWIVRGCLPYRMDKILPGGTMELILNFGSPYQVHRYVDDPAPIPYSNAWLVRKAPTATPR